MDFRHAEQVIGDLRQVSFAVADRPSITKFLTHLQQWRGMFDALEIEAARRLRDLSVTAAADIATATQRHIRVGDTVLERAATVDAIASLDAPLKRGALHGAHVDTMTKVARTVNEQHQAAFRIALPEIIEKAAQDRSTPDELARILNRAARAIENDDGVSRHAQQRRDTSLRTWTDKRSGMFRVSGCFDPMSGALLNGRLNAATSALFAERTPSTCPADPGAKQDHLRALALLALTSGVSARPAGEAHRFGVSTDGTDGTDDIVDADETNDQPVDGEWADVAGTGPSRFGRPEIIVVVDARQSTVDANGGKPVIDWGIPVELPPRALETLFARADAHPVIVAKTVTTTGPPLRKQAA